MYLIFIIYIFVLFFLGSPCKVDLLTTPRTKITKDKYDCIQQALHSRLDANLPGGGVTPLQGYGPHMIKGCFQGTYKVMHMLMGCFIYLMNIELDYT